MGGPGLVSSARAAVLQDWTPFVLVTGLLMVGRVAADAGLFERAGAVLGARRVGNVTLFVTSMLLVSLVTAVLNLDTAAAFVTPVLVHAARARDDTALPRPSAEHSLVAPMLYGCLMLTNAASLVLPGSNLTNLIVLGRLHLSGGRFVSDLAPAALVSIAVTIAVVGLR
ncbi:MAG: SLC13 family permease, partial [Acidimicrobiales bacterium]